MYKINKKRKKVEFLIIALLLLSLVGVAIAANPSFITVPTKIEVAQDSAYNFTVTAQDPDGQYPLNFTDDSASIVSVFNMVKKNSTAALINFTPTNGDVNEHTGGAHISIIVKDTSYESALQDVLVNITNVNDPPNITAYSPTDLTPSIVENSSVGFSFNYSAADPDAAYGDVLVVSWLKDGVNQTTDITNGNWTYYPSFCDAGHYNVTLNVTDSGGLSDTQTWNLTVNNTNRKPVLNNTIGNISLTEDTNSTNTIDLDEYFYDNDTIECSGSNSDTLTFNASGNSSIKIIVNATDNKVSFNPDPNWFGNETITITAYDGYNSTNSNNFTVAVSNVNDAPVLDAIPNQSLAENVSFELTITSSDADNNIVSGTDTITYYDNTSLFDINPTTGVISFTPTNANVGNHTVNITVGDGTVNDSQLVVFNISSNYAPVLAPVGGQTGEEASAFSMTVNASDADNNSLTFSSNYSRFSVSQNATSATFSFTPANDDVGNHTIEIFVNDSWDAMDSEVIWLNISNINNEPVLATISNQSITLNKTFMLNVTATDADNDALTFYTNDTKFNITTVSNSYGFFNLTFNSTDSIGNYTVNITVSDGNDNDSQLVGFNVYDNRPPIWDTIGTQTPLEDSIFFLNISASDEDDDDLTFGTNSTLFNVSAINSTMATLNFTPNASHVGVHNITFNVTDGKFKVNETALFNITEFNDVPYFDPPLENFSGEQGTLFTYNVNASDEESGTDELNASLHFSTNASFFNINETTGLINFTPTNADVGNHTINISVNDTVNKNTTTIWFFISQFNDAPNITAFTPNATFNITEGNISQQFTVTVNEPDGDIVTYSWLFDGTEQSTDANWTYEPNYGAAGNHNVTVVVSDGTLTDTQYWNVTVINVNRNPTFGLKTQTNQSDFSGGTNVQTNATAQPGNLTLVRNTSTTYYKSGNFTSSVINLGADSNDVVLANMSWSEVVNNTNISMQTRTSADNIVWGSWSNLYRNSTFSDINSTSNRYIQYRAFLSTNDTNKTPVLEDVSIRYSIANFSGLEDTVYVNWIDLDDFFTDPDDTPLNYTANVSTDSLTVTIANGTNYVTLTPASDWYGTANIVFTANDSQGNATSNQVTITLADVEESGSTTTTSGGGGGGGGGGSSVVVRTQTKLLNVTEPQFLELVVPGPLQTGPNSTIIAPIILKNEGNKTLEGIDMFATTNTTEITFEFTKRHFEMLYPKATAKTNLIILVHNTSGAHSIKVEARVKSPEVKDSAIIQIDVLENMAERVRYVRDLFMINPECLELNELLIQAQNALKNKEYGRADYLLDQAIEGCKYLLTAGKKEFKLSPVTKVSGKLLISIVMIIVISLLVLAYYIIRHRKEIERRRKRKKKEKERAEGELYT